ncbi:hypothetical protein [Aureibacter tunicatorum]|uniref:Uncharacterized protein n=1 Tax=Aureibacter tunicatorum TaxID=866807 RepID=A0AAE3XQM8_9BACT|nr:hypothetical protein [Aureibacter tunicatorum]MDR6240860.1 hypothetical protein [Aureibacter tunicatorum]BDD06806.1 hypothetical protein AUTU_42890 [Aureibacter tunicatorum]
MYEERKGKPFKNTGNLKSRNSSPSINNSRSPIQCYRLIDPSKYDFSSSSLFFHRQKIHREKHLGDYIDEQSHFEQNRDEVVEYFQRKRMRDGKVLKKENHPCLRMDMPALKVAESFEMAIEASPHHKKLFYASPDTVEQSNKKLSSNEVELRLITDPSHILQVTDESGKQHELLATFAAKQGKKTKTLGRSSDCGIFMEEIIGRGMSHTLTTIFESEQLSKEWTDSPAYNWKMQDKFSWLLRRCPEDCDIPNPLEFLECLNDDAQENHSDAQTPYDSCMLKSLGVNEYALPEIGEAFMMAGFEEKDEIINGFDFQTYMDQVHKGLKMHHMDFNWENWDRVPNECFVFNRWNNHFAGVVAKSGHDMITLENYNRLDEDSTEVIGAFNRMIMKSKEAQDLFKEFLDASQEKFANNALERRCLISKFSQHIRKMRHCSQELKKEFESFNEELKSFHMAQQVKEELFYFEMYGAQPEQTFHETYFDHTQGDALTFRIKESLPQQKKKLNERLEHLAKPLSDELYLQFSSKSAEYAAAYQWADMEWQHFEQETLLAIDSMTGLSEGHKLEEELNLAQKKFKGRVLQRFLFAFMERHNLPVDIATLPTEFGPISQFVEKVEEHNPQIVTAKRASDFRCWLCAVFQLLSR